jgi:hypothetical protein
MRQLSRPHKPSAPASTASHAVGQPCLPPGLQLPCVTPQSSSPAGCPASMASSCLLCCHGGAGLVPSPCAAGTGLPPRLSPLPVAWISRRHCTGPMRPSSFLQSIWSPTAAGQVPGPPPERFTRRPCSRINLTPLV